MGGVHRSRAREAAFRAAHPTFSVVIAAYQASSFIGDALRSALGQEPCPLEVIVGDDGSTDDLAGVLAPFGAAVRVVRIEHAGEAAAKNAAAAAATGEFLAFLDADDRFLPGRLAAIGSLAAARPDLDVITTDAYLVHQGQTVGRCYGAGYRFASTDQRSAILRGNFVLGLSAVRRARFTAVGGFDTTIEYTTDWDLWIRLVFGGSSVGFIPEPLAEYRLHAASMSARRAAMSRGRLDTLAHAAARSDLTPIERAILEDTRAREEARLAREQLKEALASSSRAGARRAALRLAASPGQPPATRVRALATAVVPGIAGRRLRGQEEASFVTVGDRRLER
jgi:glycosyltransferase involved in cell wall biosynthesis